MVLELTEVSKRYDGGAVGAVDVDLRVDPGEFVVLFGPSGSGKTTLLHIAGLLLRPDGGQVRFDDKRVDQLTERKAARLRRTKIGFLFQSFGLLPLLSARENVEVALRLLGRSTGSKVRASEALAVVGLEGRAKHRPDELSGGEQQRTALARALVHRPQYILADEPTGELDTATGAVVLDLLRKVAHGGVGVMTASHDPAALAVADRSFFIRDGRLYTPRHEELQLWLTEGRATGGLAERT